MCRWQHQAVLGWTSWAPWSSRGSKCFRVCRGRAGRWFGQPSNSLHPKYDQWLSKCYICDYTRCPHMRINCFSNSCENNFSSFTHSGTGRGYDGTHSPPGPPGPPGSPGFPGSPGSISVSDIINLLQRKFHLRMFRITNTCTKTNHLCSVS